MTDVFASTNRRRLVLKPGKERVIELTLADRLTKTLRIPPDQHDVVQRIDVTEFLRPGGNRLSIHAPAAEEGLLGAEADEIEQAFFDQDDS